MQKSSEKRVLVADDEAPIRFAVSHMLKDTGYEVFEAADGVEALDIIQSLDQQASPIDIVLLDLYMPHCNGFEVMGKLDEMANRPRVIMMTGAVDSVEMDNVIKLGCDGILSKPFDFGKLLQVVRYALS
jgi:DNA-binding response OmpR family regulator